jgi:hypothetical protein
MVTSHHMGIKAVMIGLVTGRTFHSQEDSTLSKAHSLRFRVLVVRLCKFLISKFAAGQGEEMMED